jgi:glutamine amidotransferase-like uncharacterized protein
MIKPSIAIFLHHPICSEDCVNAMALALNEKYNIKTFSERELDDDDFFSGIDIIAFPGGIGDSDTYPNFFTRRRANKIARFLDMGGRYLGICMGAYWAGSRYFDILDGVDCTQYIKRPNTDIKRSYGTVAPVVWEDTKEEMYFYDGTSFVGDQSKFKTIATYSNGDPMAIIQSNIGLIGCHPESTEYWYKPYVKDKWHQGRHHILLQQFVDQLIS